MHITIKMNVPADNKHTQIQYIQKYTCFRISENKNQLYKSQKVSATKALLSATLSHIFVHARLCVCAPDNQRASANELFVNQLTI